MTIAERIYSASTNEENKLVRLPEKLARQIEDDIVSNQISVGGVIGSLQQLSERYSAGRAAAREAVALLERRGLGRLRPGPCGGLVMTRPQCEAIAGELANYFRTTGVTLEQVKDARAALDLMVAEIAAARRRRPEALAALPPTAKGLDGYLLLQAELARLTGDPIIELFALCLNDLTLDFAAPADDAAGPHDCEHNVSGLREALAAGDIEAASAEAVAHCAELDSYMGGGEWCRRSPEIAISRGADDRTLATLVARKIASEIVAKCQPGERLGSEWDLCERFSVSRATLRQAIRQLQDSGLVEGRRGRGNGLVVRDLRGSGPIRLTLAYLIGRKVNPATAGTTLFLLNRFMPALALSRATDQQRAHLKDVLDSAQRQDPIDRLDLLKLVQCVSELADSPIIDLFSRCLAAYEARFHPFLLDRLPAHLQADYFDLLRRLLDDFDCTQDEQLALAKRESARVMLEMSRSRPL